MAGATRRVGDTVDHRSAGPVIANQYANEQFRGEEKRTRARGAGRAGGE